MKRDDLVDVKPNPMDKRSLLITLTEKGREKYVQTEPIAEDIANQVMLKMSNTNLTSMSKYLSTIKQNAMDGIVELSKTRK